MEMSESDHVIVEIPYNQPTNDYIKSVAGGWLACSRGKETTKSYERERSMEKVPPLVLKSEKGIRNIKCYEPAMVSLGPYHHNRPNLANAEKYKHITLDAYRLSIGKAITFLYDKVFEVVHAARKCYIDGSTDAYNNHEFNLMMLRDACYILYHIESLACVRPSLFLSVEYLGAVGLMTVTHDILLLENQIPFVVLEVLLKLKFPEDKGEDILNKFFNYLNYGEVMIRRDKKVLEYKRPLHLLELYRSYFISLMTSPRLSRSNNSSNPSTKEEEDFNDIKRSRPFDSVTQLKARWIYLTCTSNESTNDIEFNSYWFYGELKLAQRVVSSNTKALYLNMIAYEMCPHNPNDFRISTYLQVMKSLIVNKDDVNELKRNNILLHNLGSDKEVVKMYDEIEVLSINIFMYNQLRRIGIEKIHERKYKTWAAELITDYFGSPWKALGMLVAMTILVSGLVQTYFAINDSKGDYVKSFNPPPTPPS